MNIKCDKCEKQFLTEPALRGHQRVHSNKPKNYIEGSHLKTRMASIGIGAYKEYLKNPTKCLNCLKPILYDIPLSVDEYKTPIKNALRAMRIKKFCNHSCSAAYNNTHKTKGCRRSKLEIYLESQLKLLFPNLDLRFNEKSAINSELDIYIPSLKLAFELNGIFHYEPIYGADKLSQIQNNDNRKFQACLERGIELCIIDTSTYSYFKEQTAKKYLEIVLNIIRSKLL